MKTLLNTLFILLLTLTACGTDPNVIPPPTDGGENQADRCLGPNVLLSDGGGTICFGPSGCIQDSFGTLTCDRDTEATVGTPCVLEAQLWCHQHGTSLVTCVDGLWQFHSRCAGGCDNNPVRCY